MRTLLADHALKLHVGQHTTMQQVMMASCELLYTGKERPGWKNDYLDYKALKDLIEESVRP